MEGYTLNLISLFALILAVGILVDSGIVITEAINARKNIYGSILEAAVDANGALHVLVNNAAVFLLAGVNATDHQWQRTMDVNVIGPALLTARAVEALARGGRGSIVNIASVSAQEGQPDRWTYNASKGAIVAMTKCQALDLAPRGIRANSLSPGYVWTDVIARAAGGDVADAEGGAAKVMCLT